VGKVSRFFLATLNRFGTEEQNHLQQFPFSYMISWHKFFFLSFESQKELVPQF
jgi:hypothetical protein